MKLEKLVGDRFKERPADCQVDSHALMIRGGYMKNVANGIYSSYMPLKRITRKIEQIIREEMDRAGGLRCLTARAIWFWRGTAPRLRGPWRGWMRRGRRGSGSPA